MMKNGNVSEIFGEKVFNLPTMKARLPKETYKSLLKTINTGAKLDENVAEEFKQKVEEIEKNNPFPTKTTKKRKEEKSKHKRKKGKKKRKRR